MRKHLILAVDDEPALLRLVRARLIAEGHQVITATKAEDALAILENERPDLVVLDVMLPGIDGFEALRRMRGKSDQTPVLLLTARASDADRLKGFNAGADDYLTKPFNPDELAARVTAILRRTAGIAASNRGLLRYPPPLDLEIDLDRRRVVRHGEEVRLSPTEWGLLSQLGSNAGRVLMHSELLSRVWGPEFREESQYLRTWVSRLRAKLAPDTEEPALITTFPGMGYRLELPETEE
jgi:two-component system KDP operon response regulator KdpE